MEKIRMFYCEECTVGNKIMKNINWKLQGMIVINAWEMHTRNNTIL